MLEIKNLTVQYGTAEPVVENFNLSLKKGEIVSVVGESGSGKTTVIRSIMGALPDSAKVTSGDIILNGCSLFHKSKAQWRTLRGTEISMIFQDCGGMLNPIRKIGSQYVEYICTHARISKKEAYNLAISVLEKMRLYNCRSLMDSYPYQLSGGMKQRVGIAMAMTFSPKLLLADEPTSALDVTTQAQIVGEMMELRNVFGTSILLVTHNLGVAVHMSDQLLIMQNARVTEQGRPEEIIKNPSDSYTKKLLEAVPEMGGKRIVT